MLLKCQREHARLPAENPRLEQELTGYQKPCELEENAEKQPKFLNKETAKQKTVFINLKPFYINRN